MRRGMTKLETLGAVICIVAVGVACAAGASVWQANFMPIPPTPVPVVLAEPELVIVTDSTGKRINDKTIEEVAGKLAVGVWTVQAIPVPGEMGWTRTIQVTGGVNPLPPLPVPPIPPDPPKPVPPSPPVVDGKRAVLIVRETADTTPEMSRLVVGLRTGASAAYLLSKGHTLAILDDDAVDENGQPAASVKAWEPFYKDLTLPALLIIDPATRTLVHREALGAAATADSVIATIKGKGG